MPFNLMSGNAAGAGADMLQSILKQKALEFAQQQQAQQEAQRIKIAQQSADDNTAYRKSALQSQDEDRKVRQGLEAQRGAQEFANATPMGSKIDSAGLAKLVSGGMGGPQFVTHKDATLGSTALSGMASSGDAGPGIGAAPRIAGLTRTEQPAQAAADIFQGTAQQHQTEQARQDHLAAIEQARADKTDAASQATADKQDTLRLAASLKPAPQAPLVLMQTVDAQGNPTQRFVRKEEGAAYAKPKGANAALDNRLASAKVVNEVGTDMIQKLSDPKFIAAVGPAMGRASTLRDFIGNPPPEFSELAGQIESYALANMGVHGMRSAQGAEQIKRLLDQHHTPESLAATIRGLNDFSTRFVNDNTPKGSGDGSAKPSAADLIKKYGGG